MQDQLRFAAERRGDHIAVVCTGYDRAGHPVDFELDAATFLANSERQTRWSARAHAVNDIMQAYIGIGVSPDRAWELVEPGLPTDMRMGTAWNSVPVGDGVADRGYEPLEGANDLDGQSVDGDH